jgi:hypothetical protein
MDTVTYCLETADESDLPIVDADAQAMAETAPQAVLQAA